MEATGWTEPKGSFYPVPRWFFFFLLFYYN